jgi:hypothetical protein
LPQLQGWDIPAGFARTRGCANIFRQDTLTRFINDKPSNDRNQSNLVGLDLPKIAGESLAPAEVIPKQQVEFFVVDKNVDKNPSMNSKIYEWKINQGFP